MKQFYKAAKKELGVTSEMIKNSDDIARQVSDLKFQKLGAWMDETGEAAYKVGSHFAVSDDLVNTASNISKLPKSPLLSGIGTVLRAAELPLMFYEAAAISNAYASDPSYPGLGNAEMYNYQSFGQNTPGRRAAQSNFWQTFFKGLNAMSDQR